MTTPMTKLSLLAVLAGMSLLSACDKNGVQSITAPVDGGAFVRFHNLSVSSPSVNFYANEQKVTAVNSTSCSPPPTTPNPLCSTNGVESTAGVAYGTVALGGNYAILTPGTYTLTGRISSATDNGLSVASLSAAVEQGKFYSYFMSGIYSSVTKKSDAFMVEDKLPTSFDYTKGYVRVVNGSSNAPAISATTKLQGGTDVVTVASGVTYKSASEIVTIVPGLTDVTFTLASGGSITLPGVNFVGGHVITVVLSGDATSTTVGTGLRLTFFVNR